MQNISKDERGPEEIRKVTKEAKVHLDFRIRLYW